MSKILKPIILKYLLLVFLVVISCDRTKKSNVIPLDSISKKLKERGLLKAKDILTSFNDERGAAYLLTTDYITPKIHGGITSSTKSFEKSYLLIKVSLGDLSLLELYKVVQKEYVKTMYYKLKSSNDFIHDVNLLIDFNEDYKLAGYYLYALDDDGLLKGKNLLPEITLRY